MTQKPLYTNETRLATESLRRRWNDTYGQPGGENWLLNDQRLYRVEKHEVWGLLLALGAWVVTAYCIYFVVSSFGGRLWNAISTFWN